MNSQKLFGIMMAFQKFGGKSMKATECADHIPTQTLEDIEYTLFSMCDALREESVTKFADLHRLADDIERSLRAAGTQTFVDQIHLARSRTALTEVYRNWSRFNKLPQLSMDEHEVSVLTKYQRTELALFQWRWDYLAK